MERNEMKICSLRNENLVCEMKICSLRNENLQFAKFGFLAQLQEQYRKTIPSVAIQKLMQRLL